MTGIIIGVTLILIAMVAECFALGCNRMVHQMRELTDERNVRNRERTALAMNILLILGLGLAAVGIIVTIVSAV